MKKKQDIRHFILCCQAYSNERRKNMKLQQPYQEENIIRELYLEAKTLSKEKKQYINFVKSEKRKLNSSDPEKNRQKKQNN